MTRLGVLTLIGLLVVAPAAAFEVQLANRTVPTKCAEVDNVDFRFAAPSPVAFTIEATYPAYYHPDMVDHAAPVWDNCEGFDADDPVFASNPARFTLHEDDEWLLTGVRKPAFWRPAIVPVRVEDRQFSELHLLQLHRKRADGEPVEVLVLYPPDGYWRAKPLAPRGHQARFGRDTAFGSSFLIGPIEDDGRPVVDLSEVVFLPAADRFELRFMRGGTATLDVAEVDLDRIVLAVRIEREGGAADEIAAVRSMFVEPTMSDAAFVRWRAGERSGESAVLAPFAAPIDSATFARELVSRHNTSAPDLRFADFRPLTAVE